MKKCHRFLYIALAALMFFSCKAEAEDPSAAEFERAQLRLNCALASMASYHGELNLTVEQMMKARGWTTEQHYAISSAAFAKYTLFHTALNDRQLWILSIAGTENELDAEVDLRIHRVPFGGGSIQEFQETAMRKDRPDGMPLVHQGFQDYTQAALFLRPVSEQDQRTLGEYIADILKEHPEEKLYLTGHSLGGAVAVLAAARLSDLGVAPEQLDVITFGAPAVGNEAFARTYEHRMRVERVIMEGDPVKSILQSISGGYVQFGEKKVFRPLRGSERFAHDMVLYLDSTLRDYYDILYKLKESGVEINASHKKPKFPVKIYAAPLETELEESIQPIRPYIELMLREQMLIEFEQTEYAEKAAGLASLCESARRSGCDYVVVRTLEGAKMRFAEKEFRITMEEAVFDLNGNLLDAYSSSTTTQRMTPLEAAAYVYENGAEMRESVFGKEGK